MKCDSKIEPMILNMYFTSQIFHHLIEDYYIISNQRQSKISAISWDSIQFEENRINFDLFMIVNSKINTYNLKFYNHSLKCKYFTFSEIQRKKYLASHDCLNMKEIDLDPIGGTSNIKYYKEYHFEMENLDEKASSINLSFKNSSKDFIAYFPLEGHQCDNSISNIGFQKTYFLESFQTIYINICFSFLRNLSKLKHPDQIMREIEMIWEGKINHITKFASKIVEVDWIVYPKSLKFSLFYPYEIGENEILLENKENYPIEILNITTSNKFIKAKLKNINMNANNTFHSIQITLNPIHAINNNAFHENGLLDIFRCEEGYLCYSDVAKYKIIDETWKGLNQHIFKNEFVEIKTNYLAYIHIPIKVDFKFPYFINFTEIDFGIVENGSRSEKVFSINNPLNTFIEFEIFLSEESIDNLKNSLTIEEINELCRDYKNEYEKIGDSSNICCNLYDMKYSDIFRFQADLKNDKIPSRFAFLNTSDDISDELSNSRNIITFETLFSNSCLLFPIYDILCTTYFNSSNKKINSFDLTQHCINPNNSFSVFNIIHTKFVLKPLTNTIFGPIKFNPLYTGNHESILLLKNNFTGIIPISLKGRSAKQSLVFNTYPSNDGKIEFKDNIINYKIDINYLMKISQNSKDLWPFFDLLYKFFNFKNIIVAEKIYRSIDIENNGMIDINFTGVYVDGRECNSSSFSIKPCKAFFLKAKNYFPIKLILFLDYSKKIQNHSIILTYTNNYLISRISTEMNISSIQYLDSLGYFEMFNK